VIRGNLQEFGRIEEAVYFIQDDAFVPEGVEKGFGVVHGAADSGELAIEVFYVEQALGQERLARSANASQPKDRALGPEFLDPF
jgi:hypothetical protein